MFLYFQLDVTSSLKLGAITMGKRLLISSHISAPLCVEMMCIIISVRLASSFENMRMAFSGFQAMLCKASLIQPKFIADFLQFGLTSGDCPHTAEAAVTHFMSATHCLLKLDGVAPVDNRPSTD